MYLSADKMSTSETVAFIGLLVFVMFLLGVAVSTWLEYRKTKIAAAQDEAQRQLVNRYEQLAENTLDAQQRIATDLAELRTRTAAIEQILRTVE
jgi:F0F1-type ATP synthase membrane subunit b/b'